MSKSMVSNVLVSPELAAEYLKKNTGNRPIRARKVAIYERALRSGRWKLTTDAIGFSTTGRLINGQHRLTAVVNTKISAMFSVQHGLSDDAQIVIDRGSRRTTSDALILSRGKFAPVAAKVARSLLALLGKPVSTLTDDDIVEHVNTHQDLYAWLAGTVPPKERRSASVLASLAYAYMVRPTEVASFVAKLNRPVGLPEGSPVLAALTIAQQKLTGGRGPRDYQLLRFLRCLEAWCKGEALRGTRYVYAKDRGLEFFQKLHEEVHAKKEVATLPPA